jgi:hypothetical protein
MEGSEQARRLNVDSATNPLCMTLTTPGAKRSVFSPWS